MCGFDPNGRYRRNEKDQRIFERVPADEVGDLTRVGSEGIDNDGDGRINEDGAGGYDMNRNWPSGWQPSYIQYGAGEYALDRPMLLSRLRLLEPHGLDFHSDDLDDFSNAFRLEWANRTREALSTLRSYDRPSQSESQRLSTDVLQWLLANWVDASSALPSAPRPHALF